MPALLNHLLLTLRLNFRSKMPIIYGYLVPILFLIGFAAVFRSSQPPVIAELGQILTITILGGCCFGMPTAMVAERERGIWRRYRLLPLGTGALVLSNLAARIVLVASAAAIQIILAVLIYKMPLPAHPLQLILAFALVTSAFLGIGLIVTSLAETVPAVQALGQAIFLPMILIGGVGVPLAALPRWAQIAAGFTPGRYSVEVMDAAITGNGLPSAFWSSASLAVIAAASCAAGAALFRWDPSQKFRKKQLLFLAAALAAWALVGVATNSVAGSTHLPRPNGQPTTTLSDAQINAITYDNLPDDNSMITPLIESETDIAPDIRHWMTGFRVTLSNWGPGNQGSDLDRTRNLLNLAAVADLAHFEYEAESPFVIFEKLRADIPKPRLEQSLAYTILHPNEGPVLLDAPILSLDPQSESDVRERSALYAKKFLGRLLGKLG